MDDSEFPDAPQTPGPTFAFRAFKGFFLGSSDDEDEDKENASVAAADGPAPLTTMSGNTTPQKRKRGHEYSSPVKSILRPTGAATPRALQLRKENVAVAFKDIRKSVSPDVKRKDAPVRVLVGEAKPVGLVPSRVQEIETRDRSEAPQKKLKSQSTRTSTALQPLAAFDVEAYKSSTEKEMRKLVRYGQKMREYARKQDVENAGLRQTNEWLKRENARLQREANGRKAVEWPAPSMSAVDKRHDTWYEGPPEAEQEDAGVGDDESDFEARRKKMRSAALDLILKHHPVNVRDAVHGTCGVARQSPVNTANAAANQKKPVEDPEIPSTTAEPVQMEQSNRQPSVRLAPDRLAAARERIKAKAEKRKASDMDKSDVDWAGL